MSPLKREEWESLGRNQAANKTQASVTYFTAPGVAYDCLWQGCDYQYEDLNELIIHFLESGGHLIKMGKMISPYWTLLRCALGATYERYMAYAEFEPTTSHDAIPS